MAIYHFTAKVVSRGKGQSAVAKAAYNSRERLKDERTGCVYDYRRKGGIVFSGIFALEDGPDWARDRTMLYNEIERGEKRKDAQLLREIEIGLPHELTEEQREWLVKDFVREQFVRKGMLADVAIHEPGPDGDERNHHAHILLTMRELGPDGFGDKVREWNSRVQLEDWREAWERTANRYLEKHGCDARIDRRSLEDQGIDREPTTHRGPQVNAMEREGVETDRGTRWSATNEHNATLAELKSELSFVMSEIRVTEREAYLDSDNSRTDAGEDTREAPEPLVKGGALKVGSTIGKALDAAVTALEGLFDYGSRAAIERRRKSEPATDLRRYFADDDYRKNVIEHDIAERERSEREYAERQNERER